MRSPGALAVNDRGRGAGFLAGLLTSSDVERLMDTPQRAAAIQHDEVVVRRALGGEVLWHCAPLAARRQDVENRIEDFPDIDMPFAPSVARRRNEGLHQTPFLISQVAWITKPFASGVPAMLGCPHDRRS